jgi:hypothetical protein
MSEERIAIQMVVSVCAWLAAVVAAFWLIGAMVGIIVILIGVGLWMVAGERDSLGAWVSGSYATKRGPLSLSRRGRHRTSRRSGRFMSVCAPPGWPYMDFDGLLGGARG